MPTTYDISAFQGADYAVTFTYNDSTGAPVNVTGASSRMQVRKYPESQYPILTLANGSGITLGGALGTVAIAISGATLSAIPSGNMYYDIEIVTSGGSIVKLISGAFNITAEITR